jgi:hypothetical protein
MTCPKFLICSKELRVYERGFCVYNVVFPNKNVRQGGGGRALYPIVYFGRASQHDGGTNLSHETDKYECIIHIDRQHTIVPHTHFGSKLNSQLYKRFVCNK